MRDDFLTRKRLMTLGSLLAIMLITWGAALLTRFDAGQGLSAIPAALSWGIENFYPDEKAWRRLPGIMDKLLDTVLLAVASTTVAAMAALVCAVGGSRTMRLNRWFGLISRGMASVFRNIDIAAWAIILLFSFGQSALTGYFALLFASFGFLTRAFMEAIDEMSSSAVEALRATGAGYITIVCRCVIPSCAPQLVSWMLFMMETNIRSATLIGILTGTGIGFAFDVYYKGMNYHAASLVVIVIAAAILLIEAGSNVIRSMILRG
ncbi:PhnE/PtxC family ABC transporter permease [Paenibacillus sp. SYP-B4298]|uniref:PhnE/PtxC family ABC transporter permease n=1 Tax=Paenibacillus sp. SYP-B4298 TaxID=2996034 RepID=UPI0022DCF772|nr:ABC transporter permease subunit [Paenibacillus sp. SYP-B4298]